ncbi:MAG TPA: hypothetical protein VFR68_01665 [Candidatus Dormibacteraeota bacterium]|nr:hypothetical protein [Candidatus Dormibacteraeota bacterium]
MLELLMAIRLARPRGDRPPGSGPIEIKLESRSYSSMPLSTVQKGAIGQFAFLVTALATGKGQLEVYIPAADNEGRDAEVRRHLKLLAAIGVQIKVGFELHRSGHGRKTYLWLRFQLARHRIQNDPRLWYFFAVFDSMQMRFHDQVFLIPASVLYKLAVRGTRGRLISFQVHANISPTSHDRWTPYRFSLTELGNRLLEIIDEAELTATSGSLPLAAAMVVVGRRQGVARVPRRRRAA